MTAADDAFEFASRLIAQARAEGWTELDLSVEETRALQVLPGEIARLTALEWLGLSHTRISDATPLVGLTALEMLDLRGTQISDATPLVGLTALKTLDLSGTQISDATPLAGLTALKTLDLSRTRISDLRPLSGLRKLAEDPDLFGLAFQNCKACEIDPRIREISGIKKPATRARTLFEYLEDWTPPWEAPDIPPQSDEGLKYRKGQDGRVEYDPEPVRNPTSELEIFHGMLVADAEALIAACQTSQRMYQPLIELLVRYRDGLGEGLDRMVAPEVWKTGNDLRLQLVADDDRVIDDLDDMPPLGPDRRARLAGLVSTHNVFADLHPRLRRLDQARIDAAERQVAARNAEAIESALEEMSRQIALIREDVIADLRDLMAQGQGEGNAALRALKVGDESFENLIKTIVTQAVREAREEGFFSRVKGHVEGAVVASATTALGPEIAAAYPELVVRLEPLLTAVLSAKHGEGYPLVQAIKHLAARVRATLERDKDDL